MKLLLAHAIDERNSIESLFAPLGLGYLASSLAAGAPHVQVEIAQADIERRIEESRPDIVGISSVTQNFRRARELARFAHERQIPVIIGGTHISALPESLPAEMDVGVLGEGEVTLVELLSRFDGGFAPENLDDVNGIVYRDRSGAVHTTRPRAPVDPLDSLPMPARELLDIRRHAPAHLFSSRGCPYRCTFCASSRFWPKVRAFSPEYVVREVETILDAYAPTQITFYDDLFIFSAKRLAGIVELLEARGIPGRVEFAISARANLVDEGIVRLLKRMNVVSVSMGLESGSARTLAYLKPSVTLEQNVRAVTLLHDAGINVNASLVIGAPEESAADVLETLRFAEGLPLNIVNTYLLTPLPGTPLWSQARELGLVSPDMDWRRLAIESAADAGHIHMSRLLSESELMELQARFASLSRSKRRRSLLRQAARSPQRIIPYLVRKAASA